MINLDIYRDKQFITFCTSELENYARSFRGIDTALIATPDGFEIAAHNPQQKYSTDKLAAASSSLFVLSMSLIQEFYLRDCKSIILDSERGKIFIATIGNKQHPVILMVQTNEQAMLGNVMHGAKKLSEKIIERLNSPK